MIPKRAIFCWGGPPMSWLRQQSIESFKRLNPDWEVDLVDCDNPYGYWPQGCGFRFDVLRSDYERYRALQAGGVYFDTDIVFVRPIPESWLLAPLFAPLSPSRHVEHIACLGGMPGHYFWKNVAERCRHREATGVPLDCQAFGTKLLRGMTVPQEMEPIPIESFLTETWDRIENLWSEKMSTSIGSWVVGVHWYGGDRLSQDMEPTVTEHTWQSHNHAISRALAMSYVRQPV